jgi:hypothetical protein
MSENRPSDVEKPGEPVRSNILLNRLYREIGLLAIAAELEIEIGDIGAYPENADEAERNELAA